eukprot:TRINITY_DN776001_c0_g1_i1.p1 TRINITY_DN776001_c0_g1~~TRINITY_DN776001_c0_g1_i1.p1  ORF type:complete len:350 (-),score=111.20 TRINITY_DN776001_c0_g1_i1:282-1331(-)
MNLLVLSGLFALLVAVSATVKFDVALSRDVEVGPIAEVIVGSPAQKMKMGFEMGRIGSFLVTKKCSNCDTGTSLFNTTQSLTFRKVHSEIVNIDCGRGVLNGFMSEDNFAFGPHAGIHDIDFNAVYGNNNCHWIKHKELDGVFGLSPTTEAQKGNVLYKLFAQGVINKPLMQFIKDSDSKGTMIFGNGVSEVSHFHKTIRKSTSNGPFDLANGWAIQGKNVEFGSQTFDVDFVDFELGSFTLVGPKDAVTAILKTIGAKAVPGMMGLSSVDCSTIPTLPTLTLNLPFGKMTLKAEDYTIATPHGGVCFVPIVPMFGPQTSTQKIWTLGAAFFKNNNIVFNVEDRTVGIN